MKHAYTSLVLVNLSFFFNVSILLCSIIFLIGLWESRFFCGIFIHVFWVICLHHHLIYPRILCPFVFKLCDPKSWLPYFHFTCYVHHPLSTNPLNVPLSSCLDFIGALRSEARNNIWERIWNICLSELPDSVYFSRLKHLPSRFIILSF